MKCETVQTEPPSPASYRLESSVARTTVKLLWIVPAVTLLCLALFLSIGRTKLSESGLEVVTILVYSLLIGPASAVSCSWVGHRLTLRLVQNLRSLHRRATLTLTLVQINGHAIPEWRAEQSRHSAVLWREPLCLGSLDFPPAKTYAFLNVEVREFTFNRCPIPSRCPGDGSEPFE